MLKKLTKGVLQYMGVDLIRYSPQSSEAARLAKLLKSFQIDSVFDVGANTGQYARELRAGGYRGRIVSFEPQAGAHAELTNASRNDSLWCVARRMALGANDSDAEINLSMNSVSSSILNMRLAHASAAPSSIYIGKESIRIEKLDTVYEQYIDNANRPFLKIDTQGYESQVLDGALESLANFIGVQTEMSLVELYEDQTLFFDLAQRLRNSGFELFGVIPGFIDNDTGRLLQLDGVFFRTNELE